MSETTEPRITGAELIEVISAHPDWLELPVHMLNMTDEAVWLTEIERDCFDANEGPVLSLLAHAPAMPGSAPRSSYSALAERVELVETLLEETRAELAAATVRAETAEAAYHRLDSEQAGAGSYAGRAEAAEAERDQLRAQLEGIGRTEVEWCVQYDWNDQGSSPNLSVEEVTDPTKRETYAREWLRDFSRQYPTARAVLKTRIVGGWHDADAAPHAALEQQAVEQGDEEGGGDA